jgi:hypothetical protein
MFKSKEEKIVMIPPNKEVMELLERELIRLYEQLEQNPYKSKELQIWLLTRIERIQEVIIYLSSYAYYGLSGVTDDARLK